jgi:cobalt-zinc-cadmium efflux system outer membrane protein
MSAWMLLLAVWPGGIQPDESDPAAPVVTEKAFLEAVGPDDPAWVVLEGDVAEARAEVRRAEVLPNPVAAFDREAPEGLPAQNTWMLAWRPPLDGRRGPTRDAAEAGLRAARAGLTADRLARRAELRATYADWAVAVARVDLAASQAGRLDRAAHVLRRRAETGEESGLAARRMGLTAEAARVRLARAEAERERARAAVQGLWPALPAGAHPVLPSLAAPPPSTDVSRRPDIVALEERVDQAQLEAKAAGRYWGFPELAVGWQTLRDEGTGADGPVFAVSWTIPLFDRDQGRRAEAEARQRVLAARHTLVRRRAEAEVRGTRAAAVRLAAAAREATDAAGATGVILEAARAAFEAGESTVTDLNDTVRAAFDAEMEALELHAEALAAERDLERALGRPFGAGGGR